MNNLFQFDVVATDQGSPERTARAQVFIDVIEDSPPYFTKTPYFRIIEANSQVGSYVMTVTALDNDLIVSTHKSKIWLFEYALGSESLVINQ